MTQDEWSLMRCWTTLEVRHTSAVELELQGKNLKAIVNVLNGQTDSIETKIFELNLESLDRKTAVKIAAFTAEGIGVINWVKYAKKWKYLKSFTLPWTTPNHLRGSFFYFILHPQFKYMFDIFILIYFYKIVGSIPVAHSCHKCLEVFSRLSESCR